MGETVRRKRRLPRLALAFVAGLGVAAALVSVKDSGSSAASASESMQQYAQAPVMQDGSLVLNSMSTNAEFHTSIVAACDGSTLKTIEFSSSAIDPNVSSFSGSVLCASQLTTADASAIEKLLSSATGVNT